MNKKLLILTIALMKNGFSFPKENSKKIKQILLLVVLTLSLLPMAYGIISFLTTTYDGLATVGEEGVLLSLGIAVSAFVIFFFGLFYTMNTFYFSDDVENLLPLPIKSSQILGAKFIIVTIFEYLTACLIFLPILIVYGVKSGGGILYYVYALLIFLTLPVIPIVLDSVIVMIIMRFTNLAKNKDAFRTISAVIAIIFGVGVSTMSQRLVLNQGAGQTQLGNNSLVAITSNIFPASKLGALGLINHGSLSGLIYTGLFIILSLLGFYLFLLLGNQLYFKGVTGVSVSSSSKKQISSEELNRKAIRSSVLKSYVLKELRILFRTPAFFINCILMNFIWPILLIIPLFTQPSSVSGIRGLIGLVQKQGISGMVFAAFFGVMLFVSSSNGIAATSISREGENIFFNKYIPVSYKTQIIAKVITGVIMGIVGMLSIGIAAVILLKLPLSLMALIGLTSLLAILFSNFVGIIIDLFNPKLHWDNEQKAVKQNLNLLLSMAICVAFGGLSIYAVIKLNLSLIQVVVSLVVIYGLLDILFYLYLKEIGSKIFSKIEY
jgi:ABC-2 type transport system permease protein